MIPKWQFDTGGKVEISEKLSQILAEHCRFGEKTLKYAPEVWETRETIFQFEVHGLNCTVQQLAHEALDFGVSMREFYSVYCFLIEFMKTNILKAYRM